MGLLAPGLLVAGVGQLPRGDTYLQKLWSRVEMVTFGASDKDIAASSRVPGAALPALSCVGRRDLW